ncbi:unnamed protein product [Polarella glacialis]|uniref:Sulfotransferase domain-containing protein n=1 Tax=Polarella glacialis TaxID=89957 RepID=A0A813DWE0_POLGL|nr:unnamed protein product [Polarella glacialis]
MSSVIRDWEEVEIAEQSLWAAIPSFFRCTTAPVLTFRRLGDPELMQAIHTRFQPRPTDVHIVTYPKAGTSWIQEIAWLVNHDADLEAARSTPSSQRTVYIELAVPGVDKLTQLDAAADPRHVKWHHSAWLLPAEVVREGKVIYLMRNPKDTVVSWYHFQRMNKLYAFQGTFDEFFELFLAHQVPYGSYWENVLSWWAVRQQPNVLFLTYEDLHQDLHGEVGKVANFLGRSLTPEQVNRIVEHSSFEQMRANPMTNASQMPKIEGESDFMRKGKVGDWKNYFSAEQDVRMNAWIKQHLGDIQIPMLFET